MAKPLARPADTYSPTYFLASLGAGGTAVSFFMYLMFWVPHRGRPVPVFEDIAAAWATGSLPMQAGILVALIGIALFAVLNLKSLIWNLQSFAAFRKTAAWEEMKASNTESSVLAMPLALAMSVNVAFVLGMVFVPGLWSVVEYLFPMAMLAFGLIAILAFRQLGAFLGRVLSKGGIFDVTAHNSFAQLLPAFALAMVAVGFAAPAAMSTAPVTVGTALVLSTFLGITAILYTVMAAATALNSMLHYGTAREAGPTLLIIVPIMTILGILFLRQQHGLHVTFEVHSNAAETMIFLARMLSVQVVFLLLGLTVLRAQNYFHDFVLGPKTSPGSYALVCPAVALSVMLQFFINNGLTASGLVDKFGLAYWVLTGVALAFQALAVWLVLRLNRQHFGRTQPIAVPAE